MMVFLMVAAVRSEVEYKYFEYFRAIDDVENCAFKFFTISIFVTSLPNALKFSYIQHDLNVGNIYPTLMSNFMGL